MTEHTTDSYQPSPVARVRDQVALYEETNGREGGTLEDKPVVILTTRAGDKHQGLARRLGVNHYITKPVAEEAFVRLIESLAPGGVERTP